MQQQLKRVIQVNKGLYVLRLESSSRQGLAQGVTAEILPVNDSPFPSFLYAPQNEDFPDHGWQVATFQADVSPSQFAILIASDDMAATESVAIRIMRLDQARKSPATIGHDLPPDLHGQPARLVQEGEHALETRLSGVIDGKPVKAHDGIAWLSSSDPETPIEGFTIDWPGKPAGVDIEYWVEMPRLGRSPVMTTGSYCGARGKHTAIRALGLTLIGKQAKDYELRWQAAFRKAGFSDLAGSGDSRSGLSKGDALVGLRIVLHQRQPRTRKPNNNK